MKIVLALLVLLLCVWPGCSYDQFDKYAEIMHYYEEQSQYPIVHVYYNRHFRNSRQFEDFVQVIEETEYRNKDYAKFMLTDCDKIQQSQSQVCDEMRRTKDNHAVVGYYPSGQFIKYAGKKMQNPPISRSFRHPSDVYRVDELQSFLNQMMPNFYDDLDSMQEFEQWLEPRYSPNLIFATRQDDIPQVMSQLGVNYFLRFDLGYVSDLSQKIVEHLNITSFPTLLVLKYNFQKNTNELYRYHGKEFATQDYQNIKEFLEPLALKEPRNDILFHKMKAPIDTTIKVTDNLPELNEILDRSNGWVLISQTKDRPVRLESLKQKYGQFFGYVHYLNSSHQVETLSMFDPEKKRPFSLHGGDLDWKTLNAEDFVSNTSALLTKNFVVIGVREKYSHFCTLAMNNFFKGLAHCFIVSEDQYEAAQTKMNFKFQYGFVCYERPVNETVKISGNNFNSDNYQNVYLTAEYQTRLKSKLIIDDFFDKPIKAVQKTSRIIDLCNFPFKKCAFLFTRSSREDRTAYDYLKEVAKNFINEYQFYEIDLDCNEHFEEDIEHLKKVNSGLVVYHPKVQSYVYLKAKLSRTIFERFLEANLKDNKKLPFRKWQLQDTAVNKCQKNEVKSQPVSSESKQQVEL